MSTRELAQMLTVTTLLVVTSAGVAVAESPRSCDPAAAAAEYDRKADDYEAAAERYRAWARADDLFATDRFGSGWDLAQQATRLDTAAQQSRARAAESRRGDGCGSEVPANVEG
jgi:hypothetical protein